MTAQQTKLNGKGERYRTEYKRCRMWLQRIWLPSFRLCHALSQHGEQAESAKIKADVWKISSRRAISALQTYVRRMRRTVIEMQRNIL